MKVTINCICRVLLALLVMVGPVASAQGLDQVEAEGQPSPEQDAAADTPEGAAVQPTNPASEQEEPAGQKESDSRLAEDKVSPQKSVEPGPYDKYLQDRVSVAVSTLFSNKVAGGTNWAARALSDLFIRYKDPSWELNGLAIGGFFRYSPDAVQPELVSTDGIQREYNGIVEEFIFGADFEVPVKESLVLSTGVGLGFAKVKLYPLVDSGSNFAPKDSYGGALLSGQVHLDYYVDPKFSVAPVFYFGLGAFREFQFGGRLSFLF